MPAGDLDDDPSVKAFARGFENKVSRYQLVTDPQSPRLRSKRQPGAIIAIAFIGEFLMCCRTGQFAEDYR